MGYCCQNETESQSHQTRSFLALQINMNQAKPQLGPEFETCFECRPSIHPHIVSTASHPDSKGPPCKANSHQPNKFNGLITERVRFCGAARRLP